MTGAVTITVTRRKIARGRTASCPGAEWFWHYYATGPDAIQVGARTLPRQFDNRSIVEMRRTLKRAYGRGVQIIEAWKEA